MDNFILLIVVFGGIVLGLLSIFYFKRRKNHSVYSDNSEFDSSVEYAEVTPHANAIYLFGEFEVRDRNNDNITHLLTPKLRSVFLVLLEYTIRQGGISSQELSEIFWADKETDKVKNVRGVTMNNIRKILNELEGITLIYDDDNLFKLVFSESSYCDCMKLLVLSRNREVDNNIDEFTRILERGDFLKSFDVPLFDSFKAYIEHELEPMLILAIGRGYKYSQFKRVVILSKSLLGLNPQSEIGLQFLIHSLQKMNFDKRAQEEFRNFSIIYQNKTGQQYYKSYSDI
jgi:Response regulator containing CheY-like receiver and SARP domains